MGQHSINGVQEKCFKTKKGQYQTEHNKENKLLLKSLLSSAKFNQHVDRFKFGSFSWQLSALFLLITMWLLESISMWHSDSVCEQEKAEKTREGPWSLGPWGPLDPWLASCHPELGNSGPLAESPWDVTVSAFLSTGNSNSGAVLTALTQPY